WQPSAVATTESQPSTGGRAPRSSESSSALGRKRQSSRPLVRRRAGPIKLLLRRPRPAVSPRRMSARRLLCLTGVLSAVACTPSVMGPEWPALAKKWCDRAEASSHKVDLDDAALAVDNALRVEPHREEIRLLAARVALAELDYDRAIRTLEGLESSEARAIRG